MDFGQPLRYGFCALFVLGTLTGLVIAGLLWWLL